VRDSPPELVCIGMSHRTAPPEMRSLFHLTPEAGLLALQKLTQINGIDEAFLISTCNRFELYLVTSVGRFSENELKEMAIDLSVGKEQIATFGPNLYVQLNVDAASQACSVASGIDSVVVGETQITGQFKDALELCRRAGTSGPIIERIAQEALAVAKQVRTKTNIGKQSVSVASAAIDLIHLVFSDVRKLNALIIGAGEMARIAAQHALKKRFRSVTIINRSLDRAQTLATEIGAHHAASLSELKELLVGNDVIISATSSADYVISHEIMSDVSRCEPARTRCIVDIAMPSDIEPNVSEVDGIYLFGIDDLRKITDRNSQIRMEAAEQARPMITYAANQFMNWLKTISIRPALQMVDTYFAGLMQSEMQKTLSKQMMQGLSTTQQEQLQVLVSSTVNKIKADVSQNLKSAADVAEAARMCELILKVFRSSESNS
jgi:glutamyl-tRNA reductase